MDTALLIDRLREFFASQGGGIVCAYLFGSLARGSARPESDIDVAVLFEKDPEPTLGSSGIRLSGELERALGRAVDVVVLNRAPVELISRVLKDGVIVFDRDPSARIRFEVRSRNAYFDLKPILDRYRKVSRSVTVVDRDLVLKKLAFIETYVRELRTLAQPALIERDIREERFVVHTLQLAIQAALDVASHIVSDERLGEPQMNRALFDLLAKGGWISPTLMGTMRDMAGFRNLVVHGYENVDLGIVRDIVETQLQDLLDFVAAIRAGMACA